MSAPPERKSRPGKGGSDQLAGTIAGGNTPDPWVAQEKGLSGPLDPSPARVIVVQAEPFAEAFDVLLVPPPAIGPFGREFRSYRRASGFAEGLSVALGLPVRDTTGHGE